MKNKKIIIALVVLALLGAYFYFVEVVKKKNEAEKERTAKFLYPGLNKENITELRIRNRFGYTVIKKTGSEWMIQEPEKMKADAVMMEGMASKALSENWEQKFENTSQADLDAYKLTAPQTTIQLVDNKKKVYVISVGDASPTKDYAYVAKGDAPGTVFLYPYTLRTMYDRNFIEMRDRYMLRMDNTLVTKIKVELKDKKFALERTADGWKITAPFAAAAKKEPAEALITSISGAMAKTISPPTQALLQATGLDKPEEYLRYTENGKDKILYFGKAVAKDYSLYAKNNITGEVMYIADFLRNNVPVVDTLVNKQMFIFNQDNVSGFEAQYADKYVKAMNSTKYKAKEWKVVAAKGFNNEEQGKFSPSNSVSALYWGEYRREIAVSDKVDEAAEYGIMDKMPVFRIYTGKDTVLATYMVGKKTPKSDNPATEQVYVKVPELKKIFVVDVGVLKNMSLPGLDAELK